MLIFTIRLQKLYPTIETTALIFTWFQTVTKSIYKHIPLPRHNKSAKQVHPLNTSISGGKQLISYDPIGRSFQENQTALIKGQDPDFKNKTINITTKIFQNTLEHFNRDRCFCNKQAAYRFIRFNAELTAKNPSRIDSIRARIDKGLADAKKIFGDCLPIISNLNHSTAITKQSGWVAVPNTVS